MGNTHCPFSQVRKQDTVHEGMAGGLGWLAKQGYYGGGETLQFLEKKTLKSVLSFCNHDGKNHEQVLNLAGKL